MNKTLNFKEMKKLEKWMKKGLVKEEKTFYGAKKDEDVAAKAEQDLGFGVSRWTIRFMRKNLGISKWRPAEEREASRLAKETAKATKKEREINQMIAELPPEKKNSLFFIVCPYCRREHRYGVVSM